MSQWLTIDDKRIKTDDEGYLLNLNDWSEAVALAQAGIIGLTLNEQHKQHIHLVRDFYHRFETSPTMRLYVKHARQNGLAVDSITMMQLFSQSPMRTLCKLAGLPKPNNCL